MCTKTIVFSSSVWLMIPVIMGCFRVQLPWLPFPTFFRVSRFRLSVKLTFKDIGIAQGMHWRRLLETVLMWMLDQARAHVLQTDLDWLIYIIKGPNGHVCLCEDVLFGLVVGQNYLSCWSRQWSTNRKKTFAAEFSWYEYHSYHKWGSHFLLWLWYLRSIR